MAANRDLVAIPRMPPQIRSAMTIKSSGGKACEDIMARRNVHYDNGNGSSRPFETRILRYFLRETPINVAPNYGPLSPLNRIKFVSRYIIVRYTESMQDLEIGCFLLIESSGEVTRRLCLQSPLALIYCTAARY